MFGAAGPEQEGIERDKKEDRRSDCGDKRGCVLSQSTAPATQRAQPKTAGAVPREQRTSDRNPTADPPPCTQQGQRQAIQRSRGQQAPKPAGDHTLRRQKDRMPCPGGPETPRSRTGRPPHPTSNRAPTSPIPPPQESTAGLALAPPPKSVAAGPPSMGPQEPMEMEHPATTLVGPPPERREERKKKFTDTLTHKVTIPAAGHLAVLQNTLQHTELPR
ncbi:basic salivary proline-rich protein 1-like isoform X1 [Entelurus aequoreus]|uniref:basic salivary proline-rich protein 1-like isoform X1 n=1 Tax=Entelurus aequoreus TaxID=161455 RepID=UPI002B1CFC43|nr:basic salivary proline-rich protein 1-like isoform X1 [Entelurus aequoreus]